MFLIDIFIDYNNTFLETLLIKEELNSSLTYYNYNSSLYIIVGYIVYNKGFNLYISKSFK